MKQRSVQELLGFWNCRFGAYLQNSGIHHSVVEREIGISELHAACPSGSRLRDGAEHKAKEDTLDGREGDVELAEHRVNQPIHESK